MKEMRWMDVHFTEQVIEENGPVVELFFPDDSTVQAIIELLE